MPGRNTSWKDKRQRNQWMKWSKKNKIKTEKKKKQKENKSKKWQEHNLKNKRKQINISEEKVWNIFGREATKQCIKQKWRDKHNEYTT